jgi:two-component system alkaline phosphatase synthesis response regulator PhoP
MAKLLLVEDNVDLAMGLSMVLEFEGHQVERAEDGETGSTLARESEPDLIILDLMLPGKSGYDVLKELRSAGVRTPVLILTAKSQEIDVVMGFELGADDYLTKPFSTLELLARVRAILRRTSQPIANEVASAGLCRFGDVEIDPAKRIVKKRGELVDLTPREFDLLMALFNRGGAVVGRTELLKEVWRYGYPEIMTRTVDVHIHELRQKLEDDPAKPTHILTVRKAGYRLEA